MRLLFLSPALAALVAACSSPSPLPGDEVLGTYRFQATLASSSCSTADVPDAGLEFEATFTREKEGERAWMTLRDFSRDAGFDGQYLVSTHVAPAVLKSCGERCSDLQIEEVVRVALLSSSQDERLGRSCPPDALTSLPADGGVSPPQTTSHGFDAVRACGELKDIVLPGEGCACAPCEAVYKLEGTRR